MSCPHSTRHDRSEATCSLCQSTRRASKVRIADGLVIQDDVVVSTVRERMADEEARGRPLSNVTCVRCGERGHLAARCPTPLEVTE